MKSLYLAPLLLLISTWATAQVSHPTAEELANQHNYELGLEVEKIKSYRIDGWHYVSNRALVFNAGPGGQYLLMLAGNCPWLRGQEAIGFTTTVNDVLARFDAIRARDNGATMPQRCQIQHIYEVTLKEE